MTRYLERPIVITPWCSGCQSALCVCHESARARAERLARAAPTAEPAPDELVPLGSITPSFEGGLLLEGIATTDSWGAREKDLAAGLATLRGNTTVRLPGLDPRKLTVTLPLPLLWRHEEDKPVGEVIAWMASELALHFRAAVAPPGTDGFDRALLEQVWAGVRESGVRAVSVGGPSINRDRSWSIPELSVCEAGGNRYAVITAARFPEGALVTRGAPEFSRNDAKLAWLAFEESWKASKSAPPKKPPPRTDDLPTWSITTTYRRGAKVRHGGRTWHAMRDNSGRKPDGMGDVWRKLPLVNEEAAS